MKCTTVKIGDKIQSLRKNNSMSQEELAAELRINRNCLSRILMYNLLFFMQNIIKEMILCLIGLKKIIFGMVLILKF